MVLLGSTCSVYRPAPPRILEPGTVTKLQYLGVLPAHYDGRYDLDAYDVGYITFDGLQIRGVFTVPRGEPPAGGWPGAVWLHGFGGLGYDFWGWPWVGDWTNTRHTAPSIAWASHGLVNLSIWAPGAGPSGRMGTYSPVSKHNAKAVLDGFRALLNIDSDRPKGCADRRGPIACPDELRCVAGSGVHRCELAHIRARAEAAGYRSQHDERQPGAFC